MKKSPETLFTATSDFRLIERLGDFFVARYMKKRAKRNLREGAAPMAVFAFDYIGQEINLHGVFEKDELATLFQFLTPKAEQFKEQAALDIGANIGNHSVFFSNVFAKVISFEPNPRTFRLLEANASLKSNIETRNYGLGAKSEKLILIFDSANVGEATLVADDSAQQTNKKQTVEVQINKLDDIVKDLPPVGLIKIDVEGFEAEVIKGGTKFLTSNKPIIAFEQNRSAFVGGTSETIELLRDLGYAFCIIEKKNVSHGAFGGAVSTVLKSFRGMEFEVRRVDELPPQNYSMILAIDPVQLSALARN